MKKTKNFELNHWESTDRILMDDFNNDNDKIDAALGKLSAASESQAATLAQHAAAIPKLGNCQIYTTSYVGNNKYGASNPNTLTFPHKPILFMVFTGTHRLLAFPEGRWAMTYTNSTGSASGLTCSSTGNSVSWYHASNALLQLNESKTYLVVALLDASN